MTTGGKDAPGGEPESHGHNTEANAGSDTVDPSRVHFDVDPIKQVANDARKRHDRTASYEDWDCEPGEFHACSSADGELLYCGNCGLVVWRQDHGIEPEYRKIRTLERTAHHPTDTDWRAEA